MSIPSVEAIWQLNGKIFAMLTDEELEVFSFFVDRGRKFGVAVTVTGELHDEIQTEHRSEAGRARLRRSNGRIAVNILESK